MRLLVGRSVSCCIAAAALVAMAGCGGDDKKDTASGGSPTATSSAATTSAATPVDEAALTEALLTEADLPGYSKSDDSADDGSDSGSDIADGDAGCKQIEQLDKATSDKSEKDQVADVDVSFDKTGSDAGPFLSLGLMSYRPGGAERVYGEYLAAFGSCKSMTMKLDESTSVTLTGGPIAGFPTLGDATGAFRYTGDVQGVPLQVDFVVTRSGDVLAGTQAVSLATPEPDLSKQVATKAAERLESKLGG